MKKCYTKYRSWIWLVWPLLSMFGNIALTHNVLAATATARINANVLPNQSEEKDIDIRPRNISLHKGENSRFVISNNSDQTHNISIAVEKNDASACRLNLTPKRIVLSKGAFQIVRLYYSSQKEESCDTRFKVLINIDNTKSTAIDVSCD